MNKETEDKITEILLEIEKLPKNLNGMSFNVKETTDQILELFEEEKKNKAIMCHCSKCDKYSVGICIPCALRMRDKAVKKGFEEEKHLAKQCLNFRGFHCENKSCLNEICPLNKRYEPHSY